MAQHSEPMDIDNDFDNKENSLHHNNVLPFTEKGYEEVDVSELNMKLRYSVTPASSPMSKSYTAYPDNRHLESGDENFNATTNENFTRSLNSTVTKDNSLKSLKTLPLQSISSDLFVDNNRTTVLRPLETPTPNNSNVTVTISAPSDIDENLSLPSSSSSAVHTPEATTPTNDILSKDEGSPIMRGLKSVLNMFRSSQSPITPTDLENIVKAELLSPEQQVTAPEVQPVLASTPISSHRKKEMSPTKRNSPQRDGAMVFNDDLEKELQWKDESTIIFSQEKIPIHKLLLKTKDENLLKEVANTEETAAPQDSRQLNNTVEYMDISYNDSLRDTTVTDIPNDNGKDVIAVESDSEFLDCETTFTKNEASADDCDKTPIADENLDVTKEIKKNESGSRLKQIILDTTQDILDATLSVRPEDLLPEVDKTNSSSAFNKTEVEDSIKEIEVNEIHENNTEINQPIEDEINKINPICLTEANNLDSTKTIDVTPSSNATFDIGNCSGIEEHDKQKLEATMTIEKPLDITQIIENEPSILEDMNITKTKIELPADIPLPDEDDFEKELNVDATGADSTEPVPTGVEAVEEVQVNLEPKLESMNITETKLNTEDDLIQNNNENYNNHEFINIEKVLNDNLKEINNDVNEILDVNTQNKDMNDTNIAAQTNITPNKVMLDNNQNTEVVPMDINESVSELTTLPDIIQESKGASSELNSNFEAEITEQLKPTVDKNETLYEKPVQSEIDSPTDNAVEETIGETKVLNESQPQMKPADEVEMLKENAVVFTNPIVVTEGITEEILKNVIPDEISNLPIICNAENNIEVLEKELENLQCNSNQSVEPATPLPVDNTIHSEATEVVGDTIMHQINEKPTNKPEEEIVLSESSSPFVSVTADDIPTNENQENIDIPDNPIVTKSEIAITPPLSPPIASKGYNFNFDDINFDPFATKTKIRVSPPLDLPVDAAKNLRLTKTVEKLVPKRDMNRRKSEPERKKPVPKKKFISKFDDKLKDNLIEKPTEKIETEIIEDLQLTSHTTVTLSPSKVLNEEINTEEKGPSENAVLFNDINVAPDNNIVLEDDADLDKTEVTTEGSQSTIISNDLIPKETSSSEQSTYLSACGSSSEGSVPLRNVFNLPEIDDIYFNPFATKSKMRVSPPSSLDSSLFITKNKLKSSPDSSICLNLDETKISKDKIETEAVEKDSSGNLSNTTASSKGTDERNITAREINTEDEDTVEGPFIEADDDMEAIEKIIDFESENDIMQFNEMPPQTNEDNLDGELFIDAEAFEFLLNQNKCNTVVDSGKESLFLKFDPLFAKRMSAVTPDGVVASLANLQKRQSTPVKEGRSLQNTLPPSRAGPSNVTHDLDMNISEDNDDLNVTISKPMMVVPPAVNSVTPRNKSVTPNRSNRSSITFTSPAMAVIDRLLSLSGNKSLVHETTVTHVSREQSEADMALSQLRDMLAEKEINVYKLRSESNDLKDRLSSLESQMKNLETESQDRLQKINKLNSTLSDKTKINKSMAAVVEEYERTIASLIAETAQDKKRHDEERIKLINERDEQTAHLASMEVSFSDLHSKYEKSKQIILNCKANENVYKQSIKQFEESLTKMQNNYELLKQHATSKLNTANSELEKMNRSHEAEVLKLNAMIKRKELHITSLEESLAQKTKANEELTAICDELINKVG